MTALLAAYGLDAIAEGARRALRVLVGAALAGAGLLALAPALPALLPSGTAWFLEHFFPQTLAQATRARLLDHMLQSAAQAGLIALALFVVAGLAAIGRLGGGKAAAAAAALLAVDLLRAGAGLNPMVDARFFEVAPEMTKLMHAARPVRLHTCDPFRSQAYWSARAARPRSHETFTFLAMRDSLTPHFNVGAHVATALGEDLTGLVPLGRTPGPLSCRQLDTMIPRLREAAVTHVASLDPLDSPQLMPLATYSAPTLAPAGVHVYSLRDPQPRFSVEGAEGSVRLQRERSDELALEVTSSAPARLLVRDGFGSGWRGTLDGRPAAIAEHEGRHRTVELPAGRHQVEMRYRPPGWSASLALAAAAAAAIAWLVFSRRLPKEAVRTA